MKLIIKFVYLIFIISVSALLWMAFWPSVPWHKDTLVCLSVISGFGTALCVMAEIEAS